MEKREDPSPWLRLWVACMHELGSEGLSKPQFYSEMHCDRLFLAVKCLNTAQRVGFFKLAYMYIIWTCLKRVLLQGI